MSYLELRFDRNFKIITDLKNTQKTTEAERKLIWAGLETGNPKVNIGRPIDTGYVTQKNKWEALNCIINTGSELYRRDGKTPSQLQIARQLKGTFGITHKRNIYRIVTEICGRDWRTDILPRIKHP